MNRKEHPDSARFNGGTILWLLIILIIELIGLIIISVSCY